jgi:hypothetical protein
VIDAEALLDGPDVRIGPAQARALGDDLMVLLRAAVAGGDAEPVPGSVVQLLEALQASGAIASDVGNARGAGGIVDDVPSWWLTSSAAGARVGLSGRRVRQLVADEVIQGHPASCCGAVFVDPDELHAHLGQSA